MGDNIGSAKLVKITRNTATLRSGGRETTLRVKATIEGSLLPNSPDAGTNRAASRSMTLNKKSEQRRKNMAAPDNLTVTGSP